MVWVRVSDRLEIILLLLNNTSFGPLGFAFVNLLIQIF